MEKKLAEYRARKGKFKTPSASIPNADSQKSTRRMEKVGHGDEEVCVQTNQQKLQSYSCIKDHLPKFVVDSCIGQYIVKHEYLVTYINILKLSLWLILWGLFIELEFGSVYFLTSLFYGIYATLRTRPRKPDEPSAYSVFNPNCERIDGTFTAEQFERELLQGAGMIR